MRHRLTELRSSSAQMGVCRKLAPARTCRGLTGLRSSSAQTGLCRHLALALDLIRLAWVRRLCAQVCSDGTPTARMHLHAVFSGAPTGVHGQRRQSALVETVDVGEHTPNNQPGT